MTIHYLPIRGSERAACGNFIHTPARRSRSISDVTCGRCAATEAYRNEVMRSTTGDAITAVPEERTFTETQVKKILDTVFDRAHEAAEDQGVCETYNDIMDDVETVVPAWYTVPARKQSWSLSITNSGRYTESMTKDELIEAIKANPEEYVSIDAG